MGLVALAGKNQVLMTLISGPVFDVSVVTDWLKRD